MAATLNDRDILLENTLIRLVSNPANYISIKSSSPSFNVVNGQATNEFITITASLNGQLMGVPTYSVVSGASNIIQTTIDGKAVALLPYSSLLSDTAVIRASLAYLGVTYTADIAIGGQTAKPSTPTAFSVESYGSLIRLIWNRNIDADIAGYEIRNSNSGWGLDDAYIFRGDVTEYVTTPPALNVNTVWYIKAYDTYGLYSEVPASVSYTTNLPADIVNASYEYADTSLTNASVTIKWIPSETLFGLREYAIDYFSEALQANTTVTILGNSVTLPADWVGDKYFTIRTIDSLGNSSPGFVKKVTKLLPNPVTELRAQVIDNTVQLSWTLPQKTSLPISHITIKRGNISSTWETAELIGTKAGGFTTIQELVRGTYLYWLAVVDTDNNESIPVSIPAVVEQPPDFVFNKEFISTFTGSKTNAITSDGSLILPVNTTESWGEHYSSNGWNTPQDQIQDLYPIYIQPGMSGAAYTEVFDYGNGSPLILGSSNVTLILSGENLVGNTDIVATLATSYDGITYTAPVASQAIFAHSFRFVRVTLTATQNAGSIYKLNTLKVVLDTKLRTDSGTADISSVDTLGTIVNFNAEFMDISSINITSSGTVPRNPVYDFGDNILSGTYGISSNVFTANITNHGLLVGQKVRLSTGTSVFPTGAYIITSVPNANTFTAIVESSDSSGSVFCYPNSMRVYVYDNNGVRQSQKVSWTVRGS